LFIFSILQVF